MQLRKTNTLPYGIIFLTHASKAPGIKRYSTDWERDSDFEKVVLTSKITYGHEELHVIFVQKCGMDGDAFYNYELIKEQCERELATK